MLDTIYDLTPDAPHGPDADAQDACDLPASNPAIMIPAIRADGSLFPIEKIEAHKIGQHHLAISVFVFDGERLLIQRRAMDKYHCGGQWANTCCTHPHWGEDAKDAASRRLKEELGFTLPIAHRRTVEYSADVGNGLWERERVDMFRAEADHAELAIPFNDNEVCDVRWVTPEELRTDITANPANYTPWFRIYVNRYPELDF